MLYGQSEVGFFVASGKGVCLSCPRFLSTGDFWLFWLKVLGEGFLIRYDKSWTGNGNIDCILWYDAQKYKPYHQVVKCIYRHPPNSIVSRWNSRQKLILFSSKYPLSPYLYLDIFWYFLERTPDISVWKFQKCSKLLKCNSNRTSIQWTPGSQVYLNIKKKLFDQKWFFNNNK